MADDEIITDDMIIARKALCERFGDEHEARTLAEMMRGKQVISKNALGVLLSEEFNPDHVSYKSEGARPSPDNKAYRERMQRQVPGR